jgi:hypothetical protein
MDNNVPLPTDNIYKFYALFGLALLIFSIWSLLAMNRSSNDAAFNYLTEIHALKQKSSPQPGDNVKLAALERRLEITAEDRSFFTWALAVLSGVAVIGISYGFGKWQNEIQPKQDELMALQIEMARLQVAELKGVRRIGSRARGKA